MINNDTISIYNKFTIGLPPFPPTTKYQLTIIRGCHWEDEVLTNPDSSGRPNISQTALILIPADADQSGKTYIDPKQYASMPNDTDKYWTAQIDLVNPDYIVLGEGRELNDLYTIDSLKRDFKTVAIQAVADTLSSNILPHIEIRGL